MGKIRKKAKSDCCNRPQNPLGERLMKVLVLLLCLCLSGCAYGMYDHGSGLFWVDQPVCQKIEAQNAVILKEWREGCLGKQ